MPRGWMNEPWPIGGIVRAGTGSRVHQSIVETGQLDLVHVQADELRVKGRKMIAWMGLAMMISTRLWVAGTISFTRDKTLADRLMRASFALVVSRCARCWFVPMAGTRMCAVSAFMKSP